MKINEFKIKKGKGRYNLLDKLYQKYLITELSNANNKRLDELELYNMVMIELCNLGEFELFEEIKYRVTEGEKYRVVILNTIKKLSNNSDLLNNIYDEIIENHLI
jgi:hypothetical protein